MDSGEMWVIVGNLGVFDLNLQLSGENNQKSEL